MEVSGVLETEVTGRRGPLGSCQGVLLSQNRTILPQTLRRARFPPSAADFLIRPAALVGRRRGRGEVRWVHGEEANQWASRLGQEGPLSAPPLFTFVARGKKAQNAGCRRGRPGVHLIPPRPGQPRPAAGGWGSWPCFRTSLGYCIFPVWAICGFYTTPHFRVQGSSPHPVPSHAQGRSAAPPSLPGALSFELKRSKYLPSRTILWLS